MFASREISLAKCGKFAIALIATPELSFRKVGCPFLNLTTWSVFASKIQIPKSVLRVPRQTKNEIRGMQFSPRSHVEHGNASTVAPPLHSNRQSHKNTVQASDLERDMSVNQPSHSKRVGLIIGYLSGAIADHECEYLEFFRNTLVQSRSILWVE